MLDREAERIYRQNRTDNGVDRVDESVAGLGILPS